MPFSAGVLRVRVTVSILFYERYMSMRFEVKCAQYTA
jgi:hypothetical protein